MPKSDQCEIPKAVGVWRLIGVQDALPLKGNVKMRCPECWGPVRPHEASADGLALAHFEHLQRHKGCSRGDCFEGVRSKHPHALR
jgi:hypothetical protein